MKKTIAEVRSQIREALEDAQWVNRDDPEVAAAIRAHMHGSSTAGFGEGSELYALLKARGFGAQSTVTDDDHVYFVRAGRGRGNAFIIDRR